MQSYLVLQIAIDMNNHKISVILTGATGMVGEAVLHECLLNDNVEKILIINRRPAGISHPKLSEIVHTNFFDLSTIAEQLSHYDTCLFCLGVSSVGMNELAYTKATYTLTMHFAETVVKQNAGMTFCYISGASTDSTEKGKLMWARVKGKTENDLHKLPFKQVYNFRPDILKPIAGMKNTLGFYKYLGWLLPIISAIAPKIICSLQELGTAMINASTKGYEKPILEVTDIVALAKR